MSYGRLVILGLGVGCLFGIIGPLNILMLPPTRSPSWLAIFLLTFFSGAAAFSLFAFFRKLFIGIPAVILFFSASFFTGRIEEFLTGSRTLNQVSAIITSKRPPESPSDYALSDDQLRSFNQKRTMVGFFAVILLGSGYALIIVAVTKESRERARLATEVSIARSIQQSLLPSAPFRNRWCEVAGTTIPATEVGGDYFDVVQLSSNEVAVSIVDVAGHGIGAGILGGMTKSALRLQLGHYAAPSKVLHSLNNTICQISNARTFVTFAYVLLNAKRKTMRVATAGHPAILYSNGKTITEVRTPNLPLGVKNDQMFKQIQMSFKRGDLLVLYTDGIIEAADKKGEQFGLQRLRGLIEQTSGSAETLQAIIMESLKEHSASKELQDDATVVVIKL